MEDSGFDALALLPTVLWQCNKPFTNVGKERAASKLACRAGPDDAHADRRSLAGTADMRIR